MLQVENRSKSLVLKNAGTKAHPNASAILSSTAKVIAIGLRLPNLVLLSW